ncbi:unnamed protein product, partial [Meganyctiphanes norvegica]
MARTSSSGLSRNVEPGELGSVDGSNSFGKNVEPGSFDGMLISGWFNLATLRELSEDLGVGNESLAFLNNFTQNSRFGGLLVVTGCTDGIGKSYAKELAKSGMNILLISRTTEKLEKVSKEIGDEFSVETEIVQADFSNGLPIYENIAKHLQNKQIGILVNNVGLMLAYPQAFNEVSERDIWGHVNVNMASVCAMTKLVLPEMLARKKGAIVNIASIAASGPIPLMGIYSASKAFVEYFSLSLESEYSRSGITVQTVCPSYVATNMTSFSPLINTPSLVTPSADTFAASAVRTLGYTSLTSGFWTHGIQSWIVNSFCPRWLFMIFMKNTNKLLLWDHKKNKQ